jgi:hypothetical protein
MQIEKALAKIRRMLTSKKRLGLTVSPSAITGVTEAMIQSGVPADHITSLRLMREWDRMCTRLMQRRSK